MKPAVRPGTRWRLVAALVAASALAGCGAATDPPGLEFSQARIRTPIPGQDKTAGYFTVHNGGAVAAVIGGLRGPGIRSIEMHVTEREGDMMRMRRLAAVEIAPGKTVRFEPGGRHLMLFGVTSLAEPTPLTVTLGDGTTRVVEFEIVAIGDA